MRAMAAGGAVRSIALFEGLKGFLAWMAGAGLLALLHHDIRHVAELLVAHSHLNPGSRYPGIFIQAAGQLNDGRLALLAAGAAAYGAVRFVEAWGLWYERRWARWFAAGSGAIYLPFELVGLARRFDAPGLLLVLVNLGIVAVMLRSVLAERR